MSNVTEGHESKQNGAILVSLPALHSYVAQKYPRPPSLPTLKRWAASGTLKEAEVRRISGRKSRSASADGQEHARAKPRYDRGKAIQIIRRIWDLDGKVTEPRSSRRPEALQGETSSIQATMPGQMAAEIAQALESRLGAIEDRLQAQASILESLTQQVAALNGVRTALMNKYDAASAQQGEIVSMLRQKVADLKEANTLSQDIQSLRITVSRLTEQARR